ncbi:MAG: hypothetical protein IKS48_12030 [Eubacterium sp.]|nr:hypothetical protein [Eubacterium sp.]
MKKRIFSFILSLILVLGLIGPAGSVGAASKKNTTITLQNKSVNVTFSIDKKERITAAKALSKALGASIRNGRSFYIRVNGKRYKALNKKGTIWISGVKLKDFVAEKCKNTDQTKITLKANFLNIFKIAALSGKTASFKYTMTVGKATIKNVKIVRSKKFVFIGNGKKYTASIRKGKIILLGEHSKDAFVKNMKNAGVIKKVTVK